MKIRALTLIVVFLTLFGMAGCSGGGVPDAVPDGTPADSAPDAIQSEDDVDTAADDEESIAAEGPVLQDLNGNPVSLSDFRGGIVVLNFWASWCPPCRQEMPDLNELDKEFKESGDAVLITINLTDGQRETKESARQFIEENSFGFTVLLDEQGILASEYNINAIPQTFILDRDGNVSGSIIGATTKEAILENVNAVE